MIQVYYFILRKKMSAQQVINFSDILRKTIAFDNSEDVDIKKWCSDVYKEYVPKISLEEFTNLLKYIIKNQEKENNKYKVNSFTRLMAALMIQYINTLFAIKNKDMKKKEEYTKNMEDIIDIINKLT